MHRKPSMRNLLAIAFVLTLVVVGTAVLVFAASGDSEETYQSNFPAASAAKLLEDSGDLSATLTLEPKDNPAAEIRFYHVDKVIPFDTVHISDNTIEKGKEVVMVEGVNGVIRSTEELVLHNGTEVSRQIVGQTVLQELVQEVVHVGTYQRKTVTNPVTVKKPTYTEPSYGKGQASEPASAPVSEPAPAASPSGVTTYATSFGTGSYDTSLNMLASVTIDKENKTITLPSGEVLHYTQSFIGEATGYSCEGESNPITYSGTPARVGEVAVDPRYIDIGTRMFIMLSDGSLIYGCCTAEDTGGAVKGNIIDLYMNTFADCSLIGRSACDVYVLS